VSAPGAPPAARTPVGLPLRYLVTAVLAFVVAAAALPWLAEELSGHYYHPRLLALTHTVTLGWITLTIMGASYQLVPIVLERPVWSVRLARWQFLAFVVGAVGMVGHFFIAEWPGLAWSAGLVALGALAHVANVGRSLRGLARWTLTARLLAGALAGLALTALFGLALGLAKLWPILPGQLFANLHAHVHLALLGWVLPMVLGVAARVYPMFLLAAEPGGWPGRAQAWGLAAGVPLVVGGLLAAWTPAVVAGALVVALAVTGHLAWVLGMLRGRKRPALDWGLRFVLTGSAFLVPATALGLGLATGLLAGPRPALAYAVAVFGGWLSLTILGMLLKIVPFLVWQSVYAPRVGRAPVPTLAQLSPARAEALAYALLVAGVAALTAAVLAGDTAWIRLAGSLVTAGALAFAATLARVLHHLLACPLGRRRAPVVAERAS
jgi:hypothetical protein